MTDILQFTCSDPANATALIQTLTDQANTWSRLAYLANDPKYKTKPFDIDLWKKHLTTPNLYWIDFGAVYAALGDDGRKIADTMFGSGPMQGILLRTSFSASDPTMIPQRLAVDDLVASGYMTAPVLPPMPIG